MVYDAQAQYMGEINRRHASHADNVRFFQGKIDAGAINPDAIPGLMRDYQELRFPVKK